MNRESFFTNVPVSESATPFSSHSLPTKSKVAILMRVRSVGRSLNHSRTKKICWKLGSGLPMIRLKSFNGMRYWRQPYLVEPTSHFLDSALEESSEKEYS